MAEKNSTIMASVWLEATNDFQQRIPNPTIHGIDKTIGALFDPLNNDMWNYFVNSLVMRIGMVRVRNQEYKNPLREFKGATMQYGHTIQEIAPKWIKGHAFSQASTLLDVHAPEAQEWFHSRNRGCVSYLYQRRRNSPVPNRRVRPFLAGDRIPQRSHECRRVRRVPHHA